MKVIGIVMLMASSFCFAQDPGDFKPATSNVLDAQYPKVDSNSRVQIRFKAPDAANVFLTGNGKMDTKTAFHGEMADPAAFSKRVHVLWIGVGTNEPERMRSGLENLNASLDEGKIQHVFYESPGTDHEWQTWRRDLKDFAPRLFQTSAPGSRTQERR